MHDTTHQTLMRHNAVYNTKSHEPRCAQATNTHGHGNRRVKTPKQRRSIGNKRCAEDTLSRAKPLHTVKHRQAQRSQLQTNATSQSYIHTAVLPRDVNNHTCALTLKFVVNICVSESIAHQSSFVELCNIYQTAIYLQMSSKTRNTRDRTSTHRFNEMHILSAQQLEQVVSCQQDLTNAICSFSLAEY